MTDAERAAELADRAERDGYIDISEVMPDEAEEMRVWIKGARLLAEQSAPSPAPADLREVVAGVLMELSTTADFANMASALILSRISAAGYVILPREPTPVDRPLTARDLADVFGCMWNAALGAARQNQAGFEFASVLAEGFGAMGDRLNEIADEKDRAALVSKETTP